MRASLCVSKPQFTSAAACEKESLTPSEKRPRAFAMSLRASLVEVVRYVAQGWAPQSGPGIGHDANPHAGVISTVFPVA